MKHKFIQLRLQGVRDPFMSMANGKGGDAPPAPDYAGAAQATAAGNLETAKYTTAANRINQYTPYGNLVYSQTPSAGFDQTGYDNAMKAYQAAMQNYNASGNNNSNLGFMNSMMGKGGTSAPVAPNYNDYINKSGDTTWTATQTLTPAQQKILEKNQSLNTGLLDTAQTGLNYAQNVLNKPGVDTSKLPSYGIDPGQSYSDAIMARLAPQISQENQSSDTRLANQGIAQGTEAYQNAKRQLAMNQNDRQLAAITGGMGVGLNANQQAFNQQAYNQMQPINVINALRTGSQVQNPNYVNSAQMQNPGGADILGATQAGYNAQLGAYNANQAANSGFMSGLMGLGGAYLMGGR